MAAVRPMSRRAAALTSVRNSPQKKTNRLVMMFKSLPVLRL